MFQAFEPRVESAKMGLNKQSQFAINLKEFAKIFILLVQRSFFFFPYSIVVYPVELSHQTEVISYQPPISALLCSIQKKKENENNI